MVEVQSVSKEKFNYWNLPMVTSLFHKWPALILISILLLPGSISYAQKEHYQFTEVNGLPRNVLTCLEQDHYGYLWVGAYNGIARFDGKNFYTYKELSNTSIINLHYDSEKNLWAAATNGIYRFNRLKDTFNLITKGYINKIQEDSGEIYFLMVSSIFKISDGNVELVFKGNNINDFIITEEGIWIASSSAGVALLGRQSNFKSIVGSYLQNSFVTTINKIDDNILFACFGGQLFSLTTKGEAKEIFINRNHYFIKKIVKIGEEIWLATDGNGIIVLNKDLIFSRILEKGEKKETSIISNSIYDVLAGKNKEIWIATYGAGLFCIFPENLLFRNVIPEKGNINSLVAEEGTSIFVSKPEIYFGTNYGLSIWNEDLNQFRNLNSEILKKDLGGTKVSAVYADPDKTIWVGTYDGCLGKYNEQLQLLDKYHPSGSENEMQRIVQIKRISKSNLLILTQFQNDILLNFNLEDETAKVFELYQKGSKLTYCLLNSFRYNKSGELMAIISDRGLFHVNYLDNVLENRLSDMNQKINCYINDFYNDSQNSYWIATSSEGLVHISQDGTRRRKFTIKEGLPSNNLLRIESVDDRYLWISTISGITRFDTQTERILNFNYSDGLPANEFEERVSAKTEDKRIIFGSIAGFSVINPYKVNEDDSLAEVQISDITFQNKSIRKLEGEDYLELPLEDTKEISLPYNRNSFSIHFFARNKGFLLYHNFAYRLIGFENEWTYLIETNQVNYTNLKPGRYTFEVKCTDKTKEGSPSILRISIKRPWYLSGIAFVIFGTTILSIIYLTVYAYLKKIELNKEREISEFKINKEHELTENRLSFFTSVSHDLKTPLTLIDAPVNDLLNSENLSQEQVNKLMVIKRNSKRLFSLISDLIDFRKVEHQQHNLEVKETSINEIIKNLCEPFKEECRIKHIEMQYRVDDNLFGYIDAEKIEKILWNLLSNALKFSNKGGNILISAEEKWMNGSSYIKLEVSDRGAGIPERELNKIFNRFYKVSGMPKENKEGTGIGLAIVKELVEMHHGTIQVQSKMGIGSVFTICIPKERINYADTEIAAYAELSINNNIPANYPNIDKGVRKQYNKLKMLIVEDDEELQSFLVGHYNKLYDVKSADDGHEAFKIAKVFVPDMIITDVQMPVMNGNEFCMKIRQCFDTSHIPVIMLTANSSFQGQIEGLSLGADVYLTKPFDISVLDAQISALIDNRKKIRNRFIGFVESDTINKSLPQRDIDFIHELYQFIENNMISPNLGVESLSKHFAVSKAQLFRKIKSLTGHTPNNLIKSIRLKQAYKLIKEDNIRVSEAAYQTGFQDPNYFATCFRKEFGENPSKINSNQ
jgi:signal transduction histidine kinase/AraC-like DNA-binding protein/ligand-binding sensor domain-containing protein